MEFKVLKIKDHALLQGEIIIEHFCEIFKNVLLKNRLAKKAEAYVEASSRSVNSKLGKS